MKLKNDKKKKKIKEVKKLNILKLTYKNKKKATQ